MINGAWDILMLGAIAYWWVETKGRSLEELDEVLEGTKHTDVSDLENIYRGKEEIRDTVITEVHHMKG